MDDSKVSLLFGSVVILGIIYALWKTGKLYDASIPLKEINFITSSTMCDRVIEELKRRISFNSAIGFDCEWKPSFSRYEKRNPVVLIQLASSDGFCGLFRLSQKKTVPHSLKKLLENECIYKVGVETIRDANYLLEDHGINVRSALDLRHIAKICDYDPRGLAFLSKTILGIDLDKNKFISCSNWEAEELTDKQIKYAAADAQVSVKIFDQLKAKLRFKFTEGEVERICNYFKDKDFKYSPPEKRVNEKYYLGRSGFW